MFFSTATRPTVRKIGRGRSSVSGMTSSGLARCEYLAIHAARPQHRIAEAPSGQFRHQRPGRHHHALGMAMEAPQPAPDQRLRDRRPRSDIFRQPRMETGGEGDAAPDAIATHRVPNGTFGRDMDCIGLQRLDPLRNRPGRRQRAADIRIGRQRKGAKALMGQKRDFGAKAGCGRSERRERAHDAIDLRMPRVGCDENAHYCLPRLCWNRMPNDAPRMSQFYDGRPMSFRRLLENCRE